MALGSLGTVSYNGYTFGERTETMSIDGSPVYDSSGRTIIYVVWSITLRTIVTSSSVATQDSTLTDIRRNLMSPGRAFSYQDRGFGTLTVNVSQSTQDVVWGPKPKILRWKPTGGLSAEVTWNVEVAIPECSTAAFSGIMAMNYRMTFGIDDSGYSTRTYSGYLEAAMTRVGGGRSLPYSVDDYRERIYPQPISGFRRTRSDFSISEAKNRLDFTIVDEEMPPNIPPPGFVKVKASHTVRNVAKSGFLQWVGTLSATYEPARGTPRQKASEEFLKLAQKRIKETQQNQKMPDNTKGSLLLPISFTASEPEIYGREAASFTLDYVFFTSFSSILKASALWMPESTKWETWRASLKDSIFDPRGNAKLKFAAGDDAIIDLCLGSPSAPKPGGRLVQTGQSALKQIAGACPEPIDSWLDYWLVLQVRSNDNVIEHKTLPMQKVVAVNTDRARSLVDATNQYVIPGVETTSGESVLQHRTSPSVAVHLIGYGVRVCYGIDQPRLRSIGSVDVASANREDYGEGFKTWVVGDYGHTVYAAKWNLRYILPVTNQTRSIKLGALSTPFLKGQGEVDSSGKITSNVALTASGGGDIFRVK